jgi:hypothetical protein
MIARLRTVALVAGLGLAALPALAEDGTRSAPPREPVPDALGRIALEALLQALGQALSAVPYAMPEVNERGDIIIRRIPPRAETPRPLPRPRPQSEDEAST